MPKACGWCSAWLLVGLLSGCAARGELAPTQPPATASLPAAPGGQVGASPIVEGGALQQRRRELLRELVEVEHQLLTASRRWGGPAELADPFDLAERRLAITVALRQVEAQMRGGPSLGRLVGEEKQQDGEARESLLHARLAIARARTGHSEMEEGQPSEEAAEDTTTTSCGIDSGYFSFESDDYGDSSPPRQPPPVTNEPTLPRRGPPQDPRGRLADSPKAAAVRSSAPPAGVMTALLRQTHTLHACLRDVDTREGQGVQLRVRARLGADGRLRNVQLRSSAELPAEVEGCLVNALQAIALPASATGASYVVAFPLWLEPASG